MNCRFRRLLICIGLVVACFSTSFAQELSEKQKSIADRYVQLEQVLLRMSEASSATNPKRAELLKKVLLASKDKLVSIRLDKLVQLLDEQRLSETVSGQEDIEKDLLELLRLLESENREQRRAAEKEQIKQFLRNLEELIHQEKILKARTTQRDDDKLTPLEKEQKDVRQKTESLREQIDRHENPESARDEQNPDSKTENDENSENEQKKDGETKDGEQKNDKTGENESPQNEKKDPQEKPSDNEKNSEGDKQDPSSEKSPENPSEKTPDGQSEEKSGDENQTPEKDDSSKDDEETPSGTPTRQAMQKALNRMKKAEKKLQDSEKNDALEQQEEAIAELQRAKAELEKILRQIREEELMQTLERLEARFKRMLRVEQAIREQTEKLASDVAKAGEEEQRQIRIQAGRIGADQQTVVLDADDALVLLREDGTAQAMVESLLQTRFDMTEIKSRLDENRVDSTTIDIEDTVIASLQEMLEAIDHAKKEAEKRQQAAKDAPPAGAQAEEIEPLIQLLSELRMIRSMQQRVNDRTQRYEKSIDEMKNNPEADLNLLRKKVEELARQQNRISRILHDLKVGRTQ